MSCGYKIGTIFIISTRANNIPSYSSSCHTYSYFIVLVLMKQFHIEFTVSYSFIGG